MHEIMTWQNEKDLEYYDVYFKKYEQFKMILTNEYKSV